MHPSQPGARIHGLDTLRALAIGLVVLHNYTLFVSRRATFGWVGEIGWVGVDLFFALSGYLIGNQICGALRSAHGLSLPHFYARRLLRTLPSYYVVLALVMLWPALRGGRPAPPLWPFASFTQNLDLEPGSAFSHSWSLCIEEQFYLLLPAAAAAIAACRRSLRWAWAALAVTLMAGMLVRGYRWTELVQDNAHGQYHYYKSIYYFSLCRLDELAAGVALALLKSHHGALWQRITAHGNLALAAGAALSALACRLFLADHYGFGMTVAGYPLLALGFALLIVAALSPQSVLGATRVAGAQRLALWSYAIYLIHKQVCMLAAGPLRARGFGPDSPVAIAVMLAASALAGWLLFRLVETPCMALRSRFNLGVVKHQPR